MMRNVVSERFLCGWEKVPSIFGKIKHKIFRISCAIQMDREKQKNPADYAYINEFK